MTRVLEDGERITLGFDGSYRHDSTAIIAATIEEIPHITVIKVWEKPLRANRDWRVPRNDVDAVIDATMERFRVGELDCDPPGWHREIEDWAAKYGDVVVEFDTNQPTKFGPACDAFEQAVISGGLTHDGSEVLSRHIGNCVALERGRHTVIDNRGKSSAEANDAAVAAILAFSAARRLYLEPVAAPWAVIA